MAEWLGTGLQNQVQQFDSAWYLITKELPQGSSFVMRYRFTPPLRGAPVMIGPRHCCRSRAGRVLLALDSYVFTQSPTPQNDMDVFALMADSQYFRKHAQRPCFPTKGWAESVSQFEMVFLEVDCGGIVRGD